MPDRVPSKLRGGFAIAARITTNSFLSFTRLIVFRLPLSGVAASALPEEEEVVAVVHELSIRRANLRCGRREGRKENHRYLRQEEIVAEKEVTPYRWLPFSLT